MQYAKNAGYPMGTKHTNKKHIQAIKMEFLN